MARVTLRGVEKRFGPVLAVAELDLEIRDREFVTLLGPSGCGKTTTLRVIAGLEKPTRGEVYFDDEPMTHLPANHRDIAMVFQSYALYPHMTAAENIGFPLKMMRVPKDHIRRRVDQAAQRLGIPDLLQRKPRELSGGQRQRVALGRALVRDPAVYLLDEPLSNLDAQLRLQTRAELKRLHLELQRTFIYVTHDQTEALTLSDRIAVMSRGTLQQFGTPHEVYHRPRNLIVANFIGNPPMNLLRGQLTTERGRLTFQGPGIAYGLADEVAGALARRSGAVTLGVRPEAIAVAPNGAGAGWLEALVYIAEPLGSDLLLTLDLQGHLVRVRADPGLSAPPGSKLWIRPDPTRIYLFDTDTGETLTRV